MLRIDGVDYDVKCEIVRTAEITASDISGLMLDKSYFNDVLGTFLQYDIDITHPLYNQGKYWSLFEVLTDPVEAHEFVLPYNGGVIKITGRVTTASDVQVQLESGRTFWKDLKFTVIANHPTRALTLTETLTRGRAPLPEAASPAIGDSYIYTAEGWVEAETYDDADEMLF